MAGNGRHRSAPNYEHDAPLATSEDMEKFYEHRRKDANQTCEFLNPDNPRHLMRRIRRLFIRAEVDKNEVNILRGIFVGDRQAAG